MPDPAVFACPTCTAPLQAQGAAPSIQCPYCGSTVLVPAALRPAPLSVLHIPPPPPYVAVPMPVMVPAPVPDGSAKAAMMFGLFGLLLGCIAFPIGTVLSIIAWVLIAQYDRQRRQNPNLPVHPDDTRNIRTARITASLGLGLTVLLIVCFVGLYALGSVLPPVGTPTPAP